MASLAKTKFNSENRADDNIWKQHCLALVWMARGESVSSRNVTLSHPDLSSSIGIKIFS